MSDDLSALRADPGLERDARAAVEAAAERAAATGAADVAYAIVATPLGDAAVAQTDRGIVAIGLPGLDHDEEMELIARLISPRIVEAPARLDDARRQLDEYFAGRRHEFSLELDRRLMRAGFTSEVLRVTAEIPYGVTSSYGEVAALAGRPRAYRAAGTALGSNPLPIVVPCHRVLRAGGDVGHYGGGSAMKRWLLEHEGAIGPTGQDGPISASGAIGG